MVGFNRFLSDVEVLSAGIWPVHVGGEVWLGDTHTATVCVQGGYLLHLACMCVRERHADPGVCVCLSLSVCVF